MVFKRIELQIKIMSLAAEARIIRRKELERNDKAYFHRMKALCVAKGLTHENSTMHKCGDPAVEAEYMRRAEPAGKRIWEAEHNSVKTNHAVSNIARKVIRKWLRAGLTKEEILALPGVQASLRHEAKQAELCRHRTYQVRHESRHSQLAYAFLRGRAYSKTEDKARSYPNWDAVERIAQRFSGGIDKREIAQKFEQWKQEANLLIRGNELMKKAQFRLEPQIAA